MSPKDQAILELAEEEFRRRVEQEKTRLRELKARSWWNKIFPFEVIIRRKQ